MIDLPETQEELTAFALEYSSCNLLIHKLLDPTKALDIASGEYQELQQKLTLWILKIADQWPNQVCFDHKTDHMGFVQVSVAQVPIMRILAASMVYQSIARRITHATYGNT